MNNSKYRSLDDTDSRASSFLANAESSLNDNGRDMEPVRRSMNRGMDRDMGMDMDEPVMRRDTGRIEMPTRVPRNDRMNEGQGMPPRMSKQDHMDRMDIMQADAHQKSMQIKRASQIRGNSGRSTAKNKKQTIIYAIIIAIEVVILAGIWIAYGVTSSGSSSKKASTSQESSASSSVNVNNSNFQVACSKVSITADTSGNPVAVIYYTFVNKTDSPKSMSEVFSPYVSQNGAVLQDAYDLVDEPQELSNKTVQVGQNESIDCAYAVVLSDTSSELTLTMHDNYETFSDIGSTVVPIS